MWQGFSAKAKAGFDSAKSHLDGAKADVLEEADRIKQLKKFQLMDLEIFASSEQADMLEAQTDQRNREKWGGILHPESTVSVVYNQMHVGFLLYMLAVLPVRTAFEIVPQPGDTEFTVDVVIDVLIFLDSESRYDTTNPLLLHLLTARSFAVFRSWAQLQKVYERWCQS